MNPIKGLFLLDPQVVFLNHGSFGACPKPVFETYQAWQRRLEGQPVLFLGREFDGLMLQARQALGLALKVDPQDLVFITNATHALNCIARSINFAPEDEILSTNHEYGACDNTWRFIAQKCAARYVQVNIPLPVQSAEDMVEKLWSGVTQRTRVIYISHITSPTAHLFPVEAICQRARDLGILSIIDGAHAPGQFDLDLNSLGADFYFGNCHKWMLSPKGAAFLYARKEAQGLVEPLVVSWGWSADQNTTTGSPFIDLLQWSGTADPSAALSVPAALEFMERNEWPEVRSRCRTLLVLALDSISELTGLPLVYSRMDGSLPFLPPQMGVAALPPDVDLARLKLNLYENHRIEIPVISWNGYKFLRISVQGYNDEADIEALRAALKGEIDHCRV